MDRTEVSSRRAIALAALCVVLAGCAPEPVTSQGARVKMLYDLFLVVAAVVFVVVAGLIGWSIVRYRDRDDGRRASVTHENPRLELLWWALPTLLVLGLFGVTAGVLSDVDRRTSDPAVTVEVTGFQWQWRFAYAGTERVVTGLPDAPAEIVLPIGQRIAFDLASPDVIHSFWVPRFLIKRDVVPGRTNRIELTIEAEGTYRGLCGEFCGLLHDRMLFSIRAVPAEEFADWLAAPPEEGP
ncbi:MAG: cytochrome c oxidase subunit II [Candidatus Limnocylindria bacterium]